MTANALKQKDLVGVFETASVASEVLNGKRALTTEHIRRLGKRFNISPVVFL
jgi:HTH-type transcriptional regulator/antitoxin HigA